MSVETRTSIIIVNWNAEELLRRCLTSVFENAPQASFEVFVVDNNSLDESVKMVGASFPGVRLIENSDNCGYSRGNNQAIGAAMCDRECRDREILRLEEGP